MDTSQQHPKYTALVLGENDFEIIDTVDVANNVGMDPDLKPSYVDQYLAGVERELFPDFSVQVQYIRRNYRNFMGFIDTGATYDPVQLPGSRARQRAGYRRRRPANHRLQQIGRDVLPDDKSRRCRAHVQRVPDQCQEAVLAQLADQHVVHVVAHTWQREQQLRCERRWQQFDERYRAEWRLCQSQSRYSERRARTSSTTRITSRPRAPIAFRTGAASTSAVSTGTSREPPGAAARAFAASTRAPRRSGSRSEARDASTP